MKRKTKTKQKSANPVGAPAVLVLVFAVRWLSLYYGSYLLDRVRGSLDATVLRTNPFINPNVTAFCFRSEIKYGNFF